MLRYSKYLHTWCVTSTQAVLQRAVRTRLWPSRAACALYPSTASQSTSIMSSKDCLEIIMIFSLTPATSETGKRFLCMFSYTAIHLETKDSCQKYCVQNQWLDSVSAAPLCIYVITLAQEKSAMCLLVSVGDSCRLLIYHAVHKCRCTDQFMIGHGETNHKFCHILRNFLFWVSSWKSLGT